MLNVIMTISQDNINKICKHLDTNYSHILGVDVSNYAPGRKRSWFPYEAPLSDSHSFQLGIQDERLWTWITKLCEKFDWKPDLALMSKGGTIAPHRDAAYADFRSIGINLGSVTWCYERSYPFYNWVPNNEQINPPEITKIKMTGGEVFEFNCKNRHWTEDVDPNRWGLNLWRVSKKKRAEFEYFKTQRSTSN